MPDPATPFTFATARQIQFGRGVSDKMVEIASGFGKRVLLVHGASGRGVDRTLRDCADHDVEVTRIACPCEPDLDMLTAALAEARPARPDCVLSLGGGSVIDLGKALAALLPATGDVLDHLEVVGQGLPLTADPLPFIAVPTTAGTGAEVTRNAVIGVPEHRRKVSLRDARMMPDVALVDPALTDNAPRALTLASGLDAVTQVIEPYLCNRTNPLTDVLCRDAILRGLGALNRLMRGEDETARDDMALTSLYGGLALANAGLGAVHGLAGVIGGMAPGAPHGAICGALLPHALAANAAAVPAGSDTARRIAQVQGWITRHLNLDHIGAFPDWTRRNGLPALAAMGVRSGDHAAIAKAAQTSSSMKANPVPLSEQVLQDILAAA
ncbi:iron-containing alcohol dehydrogenase [Ruegeria sp. HKCCD8929]|uniref:iron-containing alcohol dehydrogenase n=1 Tax=Ruegeria sp. HKCCD8929 TaxID=2683006 RepID=UPI001489570F|nr:iron-containing alcohol dehydrogenase [Ruegeria sp. HKCCD8929]